MWIVKYKQIDRNGLRQEVKVTALFTNGRETIEKEYEVMPQDLRADTFTSMLQTQVNLLNDKDAVIQGADIVIN